MLIELKRLLNEGAGKYEELDYLNAANRIRSQQFLWSDHSGDAKAYKIATTHQEYFTNLFAAFGDHFFVDHHFGYCGIIPSLNQKRFGKLDTVFLLILARMHDSQVRKGAVEYGRSHPPAEILLDEYAQLMPNSEKPKLTEANGALHRLKKFGVIQLGPVQEHNRLPSITILPSIMRVVTKDYVELLKQFMNDSGAADLELNERDDYGTAETDEQDSQNDN